MYRTRSDLVHREPLEKPHIARTPPSGQAYREPSEAPVPPIALNRMASAEIPGLEQVWADSDAPAHRLQALGEEGQLHEVAGPPVAHHCATLTDVACVEPVDAASDETARDTSVSLDVHTARSKTSTDHISKERSGPAALPDVTSPEYHGPDLFARLSPEIRDMIFKLVYADSNLFAGVQGVSTRDNSGRFSKLAHNRTASPRLIRAIPGTQIGLRGTRSYNGLYYDPYRPYQRPYERPIEEWECEPEAQVLSPVNSLLFVNKQSYLEALPHMYGNTTFFFDDWKDAQKFTTTVGRAGLRLIRAVEVYSDPVRDDSTDGRLFNLIIAYMPNVEHLTISFWNEELIRLESEDYEECSAVRCDNFEKSLLRFAPLKSTCQLDVTIMCEMEANEYGIADQHGGTAKAVEEMIRTGDQRALDRAREVILRNQSLCFAVTTVDQNPEMVSRSGFSRQWWLEKLNMPYF